MSSNLEKGLYSKLTATTTTAKKRVYPIVPQGVAFPCIRYQRISTTRIQAIDAAVGVTEATVQVDCMAKSYSAAKTLADEVRAILHDYDGTFGSLIARNIVLDTENDFYEQDGDRVTHWVAQRYRIWTDMD